MLAPFECLCGNFILPEPASYVFFYAVFNLRNLLYIIKQPTTLEECNAELERTRKQLQQYENRNKMLNRKLSVEKRKERNHRIFLYGGFMESIVPELKTMTEDEGKDFLYHIAKSTEAQEYLKKRAEGMDAG